MSGELDETMSADELDEAPSRTPLELVTGTTFAGRYVVEAVIGRGGMGAVYRVRDVELDEAVALKLLTLSSERAIDRFLREVRLARRVTHPNVARTHDLGKHEGVHFLTMELVRGKPLDDRLAERGRLEIDRVKRIGAQVAAGLEAAHAAGVIHRDLKPANILLAEDGRVVLTDFGIARAASTDTKTHETGALVGTPHYMAPEQVSGRPTDARSDLYALGLILYELATGTLPFDGDNPIAIAVQRLHEAPEDPRHRAEVPDDLAELVLRCLARAPDARPSSAAEVRRALAGDPSPAPRPSTTGSRSLYAPISPGGQALAVLPFATRGPAEHDYLGEGLAEELIDVLSRTKGLRVLALGATRRFAEDRDPGRIGAELSADAVVDGTVQLSGPRVRLSARLVETASGVQRWSERFDGRFEDVFELQESMARRVAEALRVEVDTSPYRHTAPPEAIELYLRARRGLMGDLMNYAETSVEQLERSLELAPGFAPAVASLAMASVRAWWSDTRDPDGSRRARAQRNVRRAAEEAPRLAETHVARAMMHVQIGAYREAARAASRALEIAPTLAVAHQYLGQLQVEAGRADEGRRRLELALELDPTLVIVHFGLARAAFLDGDAERQQRHIDALDEAYPIPTLAISVSKFRWALYRGDVDEARRVLDQLARTGTESADRMVTLGKIAFGESTREEVAELFEILPAWLDNPRFTSLMLQIATEVCAYAGERELALEALRRAADEALIDIAWLRRCPLLAPLRDDPRYAEAERVVAGRAKEVWTR
ncbi:MAG TPA: protein kinase [Sandaracinaceae bacterium LLY-WYZ-13_1]|nr:protein kinase [Sandaracinaceae bacterium LLY-WYZ-13_1]